MLKRRSFLIGTASAAIIRPSSKKEDFASIDFETAAVRKLKLVGTHKYMADPYWHILCMGWAINYEPVSVWLPGQPFPKELKRHIERGGRMHAWHAMFERLAWARGMTQYVDVELWQWRCTMVRALACGFPGALKYAAPALRVAERKDSEGAKAMAKLTKPRNHGKVLKGLAEPIWWPRDEFAHLYKGMYAYCAQDVVTERECGRYLPMLPPSEERQYEFDQIVADRGVPIDQDLCTKAITIVEYRQRELAEECVELTGYSPTQAVALKEWVVKQGYNIKDLKKESVDKALRNKKLSPKIRNVLVMRKEGARSSTSKYKSALSHVSEDSTLKGARQFYGAHTGRWAGRGVQLDNLKRVEMKVNLDDMVHVVKTGDSNIVCSVYGNVMEPVSNLTRSMIVANEGCELFVGDYKSIESRVLAETSGQQSTNDQWRLSDEGLGPDVYVVNAQELFNVKLYEQITKEQRFWGKTEELLLGYEGGTGALLRQTEKNNVYFRDIYYILHKNADDAMRDKVNFLWRKMGSGHEKDWRAARFVVEKWRRKNPKTVKFWRMMKLLSIKAVATKTETSYRGIKFRYDPEFKMLVCTTLSGRNLYYPFAHVVTVKGFKGEPEQQLRAYYQLNNGKFRKFVKYNPYGGLITENIVQHESRDVMADRFKPLEKRGFRLLHTVHDELITEAKKGLFKVKHFIDCAAVAPRFMPNLPVSIEAWSGLRYKKSE